MFQRLIQMLKTRKANKKLSEIKNRFQDGATIYICEQNGTRTKIEQMGSQEEKDILEILLDGSSGKLILAEGEMSNEARQAFLKDNDLSTKGPILVAVALTLIFVVAVAIFNPYKQNSFRIPFFSWTIEFRKHMDKIIEENMPDLCMVNGNVQVKISDDQVAYTYGEDRLIDANHREVKGFCIQKNNQEKIIKFILENGEHIKEIVAIERHDGQVIMKRSNGYIVTIVQNSK